jgi:hypothetical protein
VLTCQSWGLISTSLDVAEVSISVFCFAVVLVKVPFRTQNLNHGVYLLCSFVAPASHAYSQYKIYVMYVYIFIKVRGMVFRD